MQPGVRPVERAFSNDSSEVQVHIRPDRETPVSCQLGTRHAVSTEGIC